MVGDNFPGVSFSRGGEELSSGAILREPIILGAILREAVIRGAIFLGGNCRRTSIIAEVSISKHFTYAIFFIL